MAPPGMLRVTIIVSSFFQTKFTGMNFFRNWIPRFPPYVRLCIGGVFLIAAVEGAGNECGAQIVRRAIDRYTQRRAREEDRK